MGTQLNPAIITAKVMHKRLFPKVNQFTYGVYYLALPLSQLHNLTLPVVTAFRPKDHGARDGSDLKGWIDAILAEKGIEADGERVLIAMPRVLGYGFNPVSFWLCLDRQNNLRAMLYEVNNTFGQTHSYLCSHADGRPIKGDDVLIAEKLFHVSPFLPRDGEYHFRVRYLPEKSFGVWIDYYAADGRKQLLTAMTGKLSRLTRGNMWRHFFLHPLVTLKVIALIHAHALKLFARGIRYIPLPTQKNTRLSESRRED